MLHIFLVPEHHKQRFRLIVHTVDINNHTSDYEASVTFQQLDTMIEEHLCDDGHVFTNDATAYYQIPLDEEAQSFYNFEFGGRMLTITSIPTGQRQCVDLAQ